MDHSQSFGDFTESSYLNLLKIAKKNYVFSRFMNPIQEKHVLWRHDVDFSMHRALKLAKLENEVGVTSTYFLYPHSTFYNFLSRNILDLVLQIIELGHDIGLHFDPIFYQKNEKSSLKRTIQREYKLIRDFTGVAPVAISFHLYGNLIKPMPEEDILVGMVNAYGPTIRKEYGYVSDSNGVWRFRRLQNVLEEAKENKLQVLTHPEWWTPEVLPPRARIQRCIDGYATFIGKDYDDLVNGAGRPNIS